MADDDYVNTAVKLHVAEHQMLKDEAKRQGTTLSNLHNSIVRDYLSKSSEPKTTDDKIQAIFDKIQAIDALQRTSPETAKVPVKGRGNRVMIFLDVRNVTSLDKTAKINFAKMIDYLVRGRDVMAQYAYDSVRYGSDGTDIAARFHDYLRIAGFELKLRDSTNEPTQKEVDVALASDMQEQAYEDNYDTAILISGDRDFVPAIEKIRAKGKRVEVAAFDQCFSHVLQTKANKTYSLNDLFIIQMMDPETATKYEHKEVDA
jgi:uncharacterized LabA/DUF88 family protein